MILASVVLHINGLTPARTFSEFQIYSTEITPNANFINLIVLSLSHSRPFLIVPNTKFQFGQSTLSTANRQIISFSNYSYHKIIKNAQFFSIIRNNCSNLFIRLMTRDLRKLKKKLQTLLSQQILHDN